MALAGSVIALAAAKPRDRHYGVAGFAKGCSHTRFVLRSHSGARVSNHCDELGEVLSLWKRRGRRAFDTWPSLDRGARRGAPVANLRRVKQIGLNREGETCDF